MTKKTLAMKFLDSRNVAYKVHIYPEDERDASEVAEWIGIPAERVFKTLVVIPKKGKSMLVLVPSNHQLDLKKLAATVGAKKVQMASHRKAEEMTGLQVGGISPLALLNKGFVNIIDRSADSVALRKRF